MERRFHTTAAFALVLLAGGFVAGRALSPSRIRTDIAAVATTPAAPRPGPRPAPTASAEPSAARRQSDRDDRLHDIDAELAELPDDQGGRLQNLADRIQGDRWKLGEIRAQLSASQRELFGDSGAASAGAQREQRLQYQQQVSSLQQELADAKIAVAEQNRILQSFIGTTPDTQPLPALRAELNRRKAVAAALEGRIAGVYATEQSMLSATDAQEQGRLRGWRDRQLALQQDYSDTISDLALSRQAYQDLAAETAADRMRAQQLDTEKKALGK